MASNSCLASREHQHRDVFHGLDGLIVAPFVTDQEIAHFPSAEDWG